MSGINLSKREGIIFLVALFSLLVYFVYLFGYIPYEKKAQILENEIRSAEKELRESLAIIKRSDLFDQGYESVLEEFKQKLSDEEVKFSILTEIEDVAKKMEINISEKKPQKPKKIGFAKKFTISLSVNGELANIMHFLYILQNSPHLFDVDEFSLSIRSVRKSKLVCRMVLSRTLIP